MPETSELGRGEGAVAADPRGNTRQVAGGAQGQPPPAAPPGSLAEALIRLQAKLPRITRDNQAEVATETGRTYTYRYADLNSIHEAIFPLLAELGLYWTCTPTLMDGAFVLDYALSHVSGGSIGGQYPLPSSGGPQDIGSAITYARRYALTAVLGIAPADDDDGKAAQTSYEERVAAGRMSREQMREHGQLERDVKSSPRKAERITGPAPDDDQWASSTPEDIPEGILPGQVDAMRILFNKLRITTHDDRMLAIASMLDIDAPESSKALSYNQGADMLRKLQKMISEEGKS